MAATTRATTTERYADQRGHDVTWQTAAERATPPTKTKAPSVATMTRWISTGRAKATDGCWTDPDGVCVHGRPSWVLTLGYI